MVNYTDGVGYNLGSGTTSYVGARNAKTVECLLDFDAITSARATGMLTALTAADAIAAIKLKKGTVVLWAGIEVVEGEASKSISLGHDVGTDDLDFFMGAQSIASEGYFDASTTAATADDSTANNSKFFNVDGNIMVDFTTGVPTSGKVRVLAVVADVSNERAIEPNDG